MGKDVELNCLGAAKDKAYSELKSIRDEKNSLGKECSRIHDELDDAYKAQNRAYESQQSEWEFHKGCMQDYSDKINFYKLESDRYHAEMVNYFQRASDAHNARDGAGAKSWSNSGNNSKALMRDAKQQISHWVNQSKDSKFRFENGGSKVDFENAKRRTSKLKAEFAEVSAKYKPVKALCEQKQTAFNKAKELFDIRLNFLKNQQSDQKRRLALVVMNPGYYEKIALEKWHSDPQSFQDGSNKSDVYVKVKSGWSRDRYMPVTDVIVKDKTRPGVHYHLVLDENGNELIAEWRKDHR